MTGSDSLDEIILSHIVDALDLPGEFEEYVSLDKVAKEYDISMSRLARLDEFTRRKLSDEPTHFQKVRGKVAHRLQQTTRTIGDMAIGSKNYTVRGMNTAGHATRVVIGAVGYVALLPPRGVYLTGKFTGEKVHDFGETSLEHIVGAGIVTGYIAKSTASAAGSSISGLYHRTIAILTAPTKLPGAISHYFENRRIRNFLKDLLDDNNENNALQIIVQGAKGMRDGVLAVPTLPFKLLSYPFRNKDLERLVIKGGNRKFYQIRNFTKNSVVGLTLLAASYLGVTNMPPSAMPAVQDFAVNAGQEIYDKGLSDANDSGSAANDEPKIPDEQKSVINYQISSEYVPQDVLALNPKPNATLSDIVINELDRLILFSYSHGTDHEITTASEVDMHKYVQEIRGTQIQYRYIDKSGLNELANRGKLEPLVDLLISGNANSVNIYISGTGANSQNTSINVPIPRDQMEFYIENADSVRLYPTQDSRLNLIIDKQDNYTVNIHYNETNLQPSMFSQILTLAGGN